MTLEDLKALDRETITPAIAAPLLGCDPHSIRIIAHSEPQNLGFPVIVMGSRVKIPRRAFIRFLEDGGPWFSRNRDQSAQMGA